MSRDLGRKIHRAPRRAVVAAVVLLTSIGVVSVTVTSSAAAAPAATSAKPTIVLVHGAFADASGWSAEIQYFSKLGYPIIAPSNPLRGLASDARYIDGVLATIPGPVVLVGHSYGGAVIAAAANNAPNVKALVYVSAFIPEEGRPASYYTDPAHFPGSLLGAKTLLFRPTYNPTLPGKATVDNDADVYINPASFGAIFAGDQSATKGIVLATEQRPVSGAAYNEKSVPAAKLPSWDLVSLDDKAIPPAAQLFMAKAAGAHITAIHSAHDSLISHPWVVDHLILDAVHSIH
jgi:pimeloyl-ACP methyl ester carboxylesterase